MILTISLQVESLTKQLQIIGVMKIYTRLAFILQKGYGTQSIPSFIETLIQDAASNPDLLEEKKYKDLLQELLILSNKYFAARNDRSFINQSDNEAVFAHSN